MFEIKEKCLDPNCSSEVFHQTYNSHTPSNWCEVYICSLCDNKRYGIHTTQYKQINNKFIGFNDLGLVYVVDVKIGGNRDYKNNIKNLKYLINLIKLQNFS